MREKIDIIIPTYKDSEVLLEGTKTFTVGKNGASTRPSKTLATEPSFSITKEPTG